MLELTDDDTLILAWLRFVPHSTYPQPSLRTNRTAGALPQRAANLRRATPPPKTDRPQSTRPPVGSCFYRPVIESTGEKA